MARTSLSPTTAATGDQNDPTTAGDDLTESVVVANDANLVADYLDGTLPIDRLIGRRYQLDQINEAIEDTKTGSARRNVILL